jgi:hypothetical protein
MKDKSYPILTPLRRLDIIAELLYCQRDIKKSDDQKCLFKSDLPLYLFLKHKSPLPLGGG